MSNIIMIIMHIYLNTVSSVFVECTFSEEKTYKIIVRERYLKSKHVWAVVKTESHVLINLLSLLQLPDVNKVLNYIPSVLF